MRDILVQISVLGLLLLDYLSPVRSIRLNLTPECPESDSETPRLTLNADVPAFAMAKCKNGDKPFFTTKYAEYALAGSFDQSYQGSECQFYQEDGRRTYTIAVEIGWGQGNDRMVIHKRIHSVSCVYDQEGHAATFTQSIKAGLIEPATEEGSVTRTSDSEQFQLRIFDFSSEEILTDKVSLGRKIQLKAVDTSNTVEAFRALSCTAKNDVTSYAILKSGCGDGLVFQRTAGFWTSANEVISPYFQAFKLKGGDSVQFECNFTVCGSNCDGDSCLMEIRRRQRLTAEEREREDAACNEADPNVLIQNSNHLNTEEP